MRHPKSFVAAAAVVATAGALTVFVASAAAAESFKLDSRDPGNFTLSAADSVPPAASEPLSVGESYVVTVSGTVSIWAGSQYGAGVCGVAEANPVEPSPGAPPTVASWDAQTVFAAPSGARIGPFGNACGGYSLPANVSPANYAGFQIAVGSGPYGRPDPVGGRRSTPRSDHTYSFEFVGTGAPLRFRFADMPSNDNSGVLSINVRTAAECAAVNCLGTAQLLSDQVAAPLVAASSGSVAVLGTRTCSLDRVLSVRLKEPKGQAFAKAVYSINGKKRRTVSGKQIYIGASRTVRAQKFRSLPAGALKLTIDVTTKKGQRFKVEKTVGRCEARKKARTVTF